MGAKAGAAGTECISANEGDCNESRACRRGASFHPRHYESDSGLERQEGLRRDAGTRNVLLSGHSTRESE